MSITLKYLTINKDISAFSYFVLTVSRTDNFTVSYVKIILPNLQESSSQILTNQINKKILIDLKSNYIIKLFGYQAPSLTLLGTLILNNFYQYPANTIIPKPIYSNPQSNIFVNNIPDYYNFLAENFYLVNTSSNVLFGRIYFVLSNDTTDGIVLNEFNLIGNQYVIYNKYANMLLTMINYPLSNYDNDFVIKQQVKGRGNNVYDNNFILSPAFSYLSVYVESHLNNPNYLKQLDHNVNVKQLVINNYAFINKVGKYGNSVYVPYDGIITNYVVTPNCVFIKFVNDYFVPDDFIERSFREVTFGHRRDHDVFIDARYGPQPKVKLEYYLIVICSNPNSIVPAFQITNSQTWINRGRLLFQNGGRRSNPEQSRSNNIDVISIFNRQIKFDSSIVNYLSQNIMCLVKDHDVIGEIK